MIQKLTGRPLSFSPDRALSDAVETFWRLGYEAASLAELERATGVARSSLYNTFGDKRELFVAALSDYARVVGDRLTEPLEHGEAGLSDVGVFFDLMEGHARDASAPDGCLIVRSLVELGGSDDDADAVVSGYLGRLRKGFVAALDRAVALGEMRDDRVDSRADALVALVIGASAACHSRDRDSVALIAAARSLVEDWRV